ncbi:KAP family P-loop NTPase fold protein [Inhella proteolytica]|uniref:KAP NTPase domain-containing protein n=1 Tax=Inhella proteolytica TaxID=2795029 RepID=A0A931J5V4_9BURK|nr:P-loop NTPase fold protein [Inhella proteolytica]MBH9579323.1 hypothetical protein [Inhella proteolytica]
MQQPIQEASSPDSKVWAGDLFQRQDFADFLTGYLVAKSCPPDEKGHRPFSLALNAGWGRGKTFFVSRWAEHLSIQSPRHPVMHFNAWASDVAADPLVAFMAAFKVALDREVDKLESTAEAKFAIQAGVEKVVSGVRRAYLPAAKVALKGVVKKLSGVALDEVSEALTTGDVNVDAGRIEELKAEGRDAAEKGLDEFFKKALAEQSDLPQVISSLRIAIESTLARLAQEGNLKLPMFVFVDELDRCRPPFAIALLEGIKHLFGVRGVCYVISTNLDQLAKATGAVYGSGFDGGGYLKRFFDVQCELPTPSSLRFAQFLFSTSPVIAAASANLGHGLPEGGFTDCDWGSAEHSALCWVADEFGLDLRSQEQVFGAIEASVSTLRDGRIHLIWLATLCAIRHKHPAVFDDITRPNGSNLTNAWGVMGIAGRPHSYMSYDSQAGRHVQRTVTLLEVAERYYRNAFKCEKLEKRTPAHGLDYPNHWLQHLSSLGSHSELFRYFAAVSSAGYLSRSGAG